jgi:hypothetical protein
MRIRLHGTADECRAVAGLLRGLEPAVDIVSVSEPCRDRGHSVLVRVYVEIRLPAPPSAGRVAQHEKGLSQ